MSVKLYVDAKLKGNDFQAGTLKSDIEVFRLAMAQIAKRLAIGVRHVRPLPYSKVHEMQ